MVAMGISAGARIIFADEPTKGLDQKRVTLVADTLNRLETEALLCVTHDLQFAASVCRKVCVMYAAQQVEYGSADQVLGQPLHPYTQAMVQAMPENGMHVREGFAPETASGSGCRFRARCPYARAQCEAMPPLVTVNDRKVRCWRYAAGNETADQTLSEPR